MTHLLVKKSLFAAVAALAVCGATTVYAQTDRPAMGSWRYEATTTSNRVTTNGRCEGMSYGTGEASCGTVTGGTPGGNASRN